MLTANRANAMTDLRPEAELLCCCARTRMDPETAERIAALVREDLDWGYFLWTARPHGVTSLAARSLAGAGADHTPEEVLATLRADADANALRNIALTAELLDLLAALQERGIDGVPHKGPALADALYGDIALRWFVDLDVFVRREDVAGAREAMIARGYACLPDDGFAPSQHAAHRRFEHQYHLRREGSQGDVELQWAITRRSLGLGADPGFLWADLRSASLAGREVLAFAPEHLLLLLCAHGTRHVWCRIAWIADVAELIRARPDLDWSAAIERARALGADRSLFIGILLARDVLGARVPEAISEQIQGDAAAQAQAAQVTNALLVGRGMAPSVRTRRLYALRARRRLRDKLRDAVAFAITPTAEDIAALRLPESLRFLYYGVRPFRLLGALIGRLAARALRPRANPARAEKR